MREERVRCGVPLRVWEELGDRRFKKKEGEERIIKLSGCCCKGMMKGREVGPFEGGAKGVWGRGRWEGS